MMIAYGSLVFLCWYLVCLSSCDGNLERCPYGDVVYVSGNGTDDGCWYNSSLVNPCKTLDHALRRPNLSNACIMLNGSQDLYSTHHLLNIHNFSMTEVSGQTGVQIQCHWDFVYGYGGISFEQCSNIVLQRLAFYGCGMLSSLPRSSAKLQPVTMSASLLFKKVFHLSLIAIHVQSSHGYGILMWNTCGYVLVQQVQVTEGFINFHGFDSSYGDNKSDHANNCVSGGGIYIALSEYNLDGHNCDCNFTFMDHVFIGRNFAKYNTTDIDQARCSKLAGHGGGLTISVSGSSARNTFILNNVTLSSNLGLWGGGLYIEFLMNPVDNLVQCFYCTFAHNYAKFGGGGVRVYNPTDPRFSNRVEFRHSDFVTNYAYRGGAYSEYRALRCTDQREVPHQATLFQTCMFNGSEASQGSGLHIDHTFVMLVDTVIQYNRELEPVEETYGQGAIFAVSSGIVFVGSNLVSENSKTACVLADSYLYLDGSLRFTDNNGRFGGAMGLYGLSRVYIFEHAFLLFHENHADIQGGGMYVVTPGPPMTPLNTTEFNGDSCFFGFVGLNGNSRSPIGFNATIVFSGNSAPIGSAQSIFVTSLQSCRLSGDPRIDNDVFTKWAVFNFVNNSQPEIGTYPALLHANCTPYFVPGRPQNVSVVVRDERGNILPETVHVSLHDKAGKVSECSESSNSFYVVNSKTFELTIYGTENCVFDIRIETVVGSPLVSVIKNAVLTKCPFGFKQTERKCTCAAEQPLANGITRCSGDDVFMLEGLWAPNYINSDEYDPIECPSEYCHACRYGVKWSGIDCLYVPDGQCADGRDQSAVICGACKKGYSVVLGGETCKDCKSSKNWMFITPLILLGLSVLVLIIMWCNLDIYTAYLNCIFYVYQAVPLLFPSSRLMDSAMLVFTNVVNLKGTGGVVKGICFIHGLTDIQKIAFLYAIPAYVVVFLFIVCLITSRHPNCYFQRNNCINAFVVIAILVYSEFTRITFLLLKPASVDGKLVVYVSGNMTYFGKEHLPYAVVAMFVLVFIVILFPLMLLFTWQLKRLPVVGDYVSRMSPIFDAFQYCFTDSCRWFAGFYLICQAVLLSIAVFLPSNGIKFTATSLVCILSLTILSWLLPYRDMNHNRFDMLLLLIVASIAAVSNGRYGSYSPRYRHQIGHAIDVFLYLPLIFWIFHTIYRYRNKCCIPCISRFAQSTLGDQYLPAPHTPIPARVQETEDYGGVNYVFYDD